MDKIIVPLLIILFFSCKNNENENREILASVFEHNLYIEDIQDAIPENLGREDSILFVNSNVNLWIRKQLMLYKAEVNLNDKQKAINKIVEDYRASLLIDKYIQEFLKQKLDTTVSQEQVKQYYSKYPESFILNRPIFRGALCKVSKENEETHLIRKSFYSKEENDWINFLKMAETNDVFVKDLTQKWSPFSEISNLLPIKITNPENILKLNRHINTQDEQYFYYVKIIEYRLKGELQPLELIKNQVKLIILNKRKAELVTELENTIYNNAVEKGNVEIYD